MEFSTFSREGRTAEAERAELPSTASTSKGQQEKGEGNQTLGQDQSRDDFLFCFPPVSPTLDLKGAPDSELCPVRDRRAPRTKPCSFWMEEQERENPLDQSRLYSFFHAPATRQSQRSEGKATCSLRERNPSL